MAESYLQHPLPDPAKRRLSLKLIMIIVAGVIVLTGVTVAVLYFWNRQALVNEVISGLKQVPELMEKAKTDSQGGYPATITSSHLPPSEKVDYVGIGSFDGTVYCVTGTSKEDSSIVYHINSASKEPQPESCLAAANVSAPPAPGNLAIQSVGPNQINVGWSPAAYASSYTLECATDPDFRESATNKNFSTTSGVCEGLKAQTDYYVRVRGNSTAEGGEWSMTVNATTVKLSVVPTNVIATATSVSTFTYSWDRVENTLYYLVEMASDNNFTKDVVQIKVEPDSPRSGTFSNLEPDTYYWIHIKSITADFSESQAAFSEQVLVRTLK